MPFEAELHAVPPGQMCCFAGISNPSDILLSGGEKER